MFASLLRHTRRSRKPQHSPYSSPYATRNGGRDGDAELEHDDSSDGYNLQDEDEHERDGPLLPLFSSEHLDRLPIYHTTHSIRILVIQKCETTLSWDQLRSPQVSQFLVKPVQQQIRAAHFSRATLYALIANCLQFQKEGHLNPGNVGVSKTRALICELLAVRLLKEYTTRELIDALFYDFDPLQGIAPPSSQGQQMQMRTPRTARISAVEISIRGQAKKFLSHPLVVRQLEAVWAGAIVFHSAADSLHRKPPKQKRRVHRGRNYGAIAHEDPDRTPTKGKPLAPPLAVPPGSSGSNEPSIRRSVTLYDPRDASLFKLSRLRVPRYRQVFSTLSFAILLGLFLAVLIQQSLDISGLEILFWFWSAGYMLDEIVGFSEQGFGLYIISVWNAFDLGILLLLIAYYILRLYGILMPDVQRHDVASMAYDVLASTAVLLFPRLFSVLDHYRYFSQLLIAFRMMALDLVAVLLLIIISCSGFFVAFTLAFSNSIPDAGSAAYALFQMIMGFTPAAWDMWNNYNMLGRTILTLFLFICHFLVVTILVSVLTNSFTAVVRNANEEHQFLFAVNTISMVKSDALFSYIAPTNVVGWLLTPTRYLMPFRSFVRLNRTIIKATHFPILLTIFLYERLILSRRAYEPTDLVEQRGRAPSKMPAFSMRGGDLFSPGTRLREPSVTTFQKDRALEEVFRRPFRDSVRRPDDGSGERRKSSNVVRDWMQGMGHAGPAPPLEQSRAMIYRLETRRPVPKRASTAQKLPLLARRGSPRKARSVTSQPGENMPLSPRRYSTIQEYPGLNMDEPQQTDADGDDELLTNDEDDKTYDPTIEGGDSDKENRGVLRQVVDSDTEFFNTSVPVRTQSLGSNTIMTSQHVGVDDELISPRRQTHNRNTSSSTILFSPGRAARSKPSSRPSSPPKRVHSRPQTALSGAATPAVGGHRTPKRPSATRSGTTAGQAASRPRAIHGNQDNRLSMPTFASLVDLGGRKRMSSFSAEALDLASDLGDNRHGPDPLATMPASFSTQLEAALARRRRHGDRDPDEIANRIMIARMGALEEGFREVVREVKEWRREGEESKVGSRLGSKAASKAGSKGSSLVGDSSTGQMMSRTSLTKKKGKQKATKMGDEALPGSSQATLEATPDEEAELGRSDDRRGSR